MYCTKCLKIFPISVLLALTDLETSEVCLRYLENVAPPSKTDLRKANWYMTRKGVLHQRLCRFFPPERHLPMTWCRLVWGDVLETLGNSSFGQDWKSAKLDVPSVKVSKSRRTNQHKHTKTVVLDCLRLSLDVELNLHIYFVKKTQKKTH